MKKLLALFLVLALALSFAACGKKSTNRLEEIKERGYIDLVTEPYFAPNEFIDPSKSGQEQYVGYDIEIAEYIAEKLGVELKITALDFSAVLAGIADGKYDFSISAIAYNPSRAESMCLSDVYQQSSDGYGFLVRTEDVEKYTSIEDLADAVVITQSGSVQESLYNDNVKKSKEFKLVANMTDAYLAVAENKADVCICSATSATLYAEANGGLQVVPTFRFDIDPNMNGTVVAMPPEGSEELRDFINECIKELVDAGQIVEWEAEYTEYAKELGIME